MTSNVSKVAPRQAAKWFAGRGYKVLPLHGRNSAGGCTCGKADCPSPAKHPVAALVRNGVKNASSDPEIVAGWFKNDTYNYGVATDPFVVIDVDEKNGGLERWREISAKPTQGLIHTWTVNTGGGGLHLYFRNPGEIGCGTLDKSIDLRGVGGYVVGPCSVHASSKLYQWAPQCSPAEAPLAELPDWLHTLILNRSSGNGVAVPVEEWRKRVHERTPDGERHKRFLQIAGHLLARGVDPIVTRDLMFALNAQNFDPPLGERDCLRMLERIAERELSKYSFPAFNKPRNSVKGDSDNDKHSPDNLIKLAQVRQAQRSAAGSYTEMSLANGFVTANLERYRYCGQVGGWYIWTDNVWKRDERALVRYNIAQYCKATASLSPDERTRKRLETNRIVSAMHDLAKCDERITVTADIWDTDPWLLNTPDGVADLRAGEMRDARPEDYLSQVTAVTPDEDCLTPRWTQFLDEITDGDVELQKYLQRMMGLCLTGITVEEAVFFLYGHGANGKSVFLSTMTGILNDYHRVAPIEMLVCSKGQSDRHPTEAAGLMGRRLVTAHETEKGRQWSEAKIKALTGGDKHTARLMRKDFVDYVPIYKLVVAGNHKPSLASVDESWRRRFHLIPFTVTIPKEQRDPALAKKLKEEWPGILYWALEGCVEWQRIGLAPPPVVHDATEEYLQEQDTIAAWLDECTERVLTAVTPLSTLFEHWKKWCEDNGQAAKVGTSSDLADALKKNFTSKRRNVGWVFFGIRLKGFGSYDS